MAKTPTENTAEAWHKSFAVDANNSAWRLAEQRTDASGDARLLDAAHAAAWHWQAIVTESHRMRAKMLLAHVHALVGLGASALNMAEEMRAYFLGKGDTPDWELAFTHIIYANAARVAGSEPAYRSAYQLALDTVNGIKDEEDKQIVLATFRQVPAP